MNKKFIKMLFLIFILAITLIFPNESFSASSSYTIDSYNINMKVNENNTFDITETIVADFKYSAHGITRKIPITNTVRRLDGTTYKNNAKITNISVNGQYTKETENGYLYLKIGNSNKTLRGKQEYIIKYTYDIGSDPLKDEDEFYYNLVGDQWDTDINKISFTITMPKSFDSSTLGFSSGVSGSVDNTNVAYNISGNTITGIYNNTLPAYNGLTIRLTLPEGYFVGAHNNNTNYYFIIGLIVVFIFIALVLWFLYGRDNPVVDTVEFYPPEGLNSAELGYMYYGISDNKGIVSLLIYLADKGYLKIEESKDKDYTKLKIIKLKEYDGNNESEKLFLNDLFKKGNSVSYGDLYDSFYVTVNKIKKLITQENKQKLFDKKSLTAKIFLIPLAVIIYLLITITPFYDTGMSSSLIIALAFPGMFLFGTIAINFSTQKKELKIPITIFIFIIFIMMFYLMVFPVVNISPIYLNTYIIGIIGIIILSIFSKLIQKRTPWGTEMLGKVNGFKRFLETAEKSQLEALVEKNPQYFYNILPYTYALDVSEKWIKQFSGIAVPAPTWFDSDYTFNLNSFDTFMSSTMSSVSSSMTSSPSSSSGGYSGGGSGGGGGSSW